MPNTNSPQMLIAVPYLARSASIFWKIGYRSKQKDNLEKGLWLFVEAAGNVVSFLGSLGKWLFGAPVLTANGNLPFSSIRSSLGPWWARDFWLTIQWLRNARQVQKFLTTLPNKNFVNTMQKWPCIFAGIKNQISFKLGLWFLPDLYVCFSLILIPSDLQVPPLHSTSSTVAITLIATKTLT